MSPRTRPIRIAAIASALSLLLAACGDNPSGEEQPAEPEQTDEAAAEAEPEAAEAAKPEAPARTAATIAEGPDVCFKAIARQLGADAKVAEIASEFSAGSEIDSSDTAPEGQMTACSVKYQSPDDPRKLLTLAMDVKTGSFGPPQPMEIKVSGGDAEKFDLENFLMPLSQAKAGALAVSMEGNKVAMSRAFSDFAWTGVRLLPPDAKRRTHALRLEANGRLQSNDVRKAVFAIYQVDGRIVIENNLVPK